MNQPTKPPERAINAIRRIAPATQAVGRAVQVAGIGAALAAVALWATAGARFVADWPRGTLAAVILAAVLAAPAAWLLHAGATLRDLARLPRTVTTVPQLPRLRHGGLRQLIRTVRTTVGEYGDRVGPWRAAIEVSTPWFWTWTAAAAIAAAIELALVPIAAVAAALT